MPRVSLQFIVVIAETTRVLSLSLAALSLAITVVAVPFPARAEYRAFLLVITNTQTGQTRTVTSTLDDIQYRGYYPLKRDEAIMIQDTWMCWGSQREGVHYCPSPHNTQGPAADPAPTASSGTARQPASPPR